MNHRGRKSAAALSIIPAAASFRPKPPEHLNDVIGGARLDIRLQAAERFRIGMEDPDHLVGERADIDAELGGARVYPVVDVGNVADIGDVIRPIKVPPKPQPHVAADEHTAVADM